MSETLYGIFKALEDSRKLIGTRRLGLLILIGSPLIMIGYTLTMLYATTMMLEVTALVAVLAVLGVLFASLSASRVGERAGLC